MLFEIPFEYYINIKLCKWKVKSVLVNFIFSSWVINKGPIIVFFIYKYLQIKCLIKTLNIDKMEITDFNFCRYSIHL